MSDENDTTGQQQQQQSAADIAENHDGSLSDLVNARLAREAAANPPPDDDDQDGESNGLSDESHAEGTEHDAVDDTTDEDVKPDVKRPGANTFSRMQRNMGIKERQLAEERSARRAEQQELVRLKAELERERSRPSTDEDDVVDSIRAGIMRRTGIKDPNDPKVQLALRAAAADLTAEAYPEGAEAVEDLKRRRDERALARKEREKFKSYDERIASMERERIEAETHAQEANLKSRAVEFLSKNTEALPYLNDAAELGEISPQDFIVETAREMVRTGQARDPQDLRELGQLYGMIATNLNEHYRQVSEKFSSRSAKRTGSSIVTEKKATPSTNETKRVSPEQERGQVKRTNGKTKAPMGGGGRGIAEPIHISQDDPEDDSLAARVNRRKAAEAAADRRSRQR